MNRNFRQDQRSDLVRLFPSTSSNRRGARNNHPSTIDPQSIRMHLGAFSRTRSSGGFLKWKAVQLVLNTIPLFNKAGIVRRPSTKIPENVPSQSAQQARSEHAAAMKQARSGHEVAMESSPQCPLTFHESSTRFPRSGPRNVREASKPYSGNGQEVVPIASLMHDPRSD